MPEYGETTLSQAENGAPVSKMLLTIKDVARQLQIKPSTLYAWATQGKIPCLKVHRLIRFRPEEIAQWVESFRQSRPEYIPVGFKNVNRNEINDLIAHARREVYSARHGETRPKSSLSRKEGNDGAL